MVKLTSLTSSGSLTSTDSRTDTGGYDNRTYLPRRFENPYDTPTNIMRGSMMKWCEKTVTDECGAVARFV